jgi:hypothetical protein
MSDPDGVAVAHGWADDSGLWLQVADVATFRFQPGGDEITAFVAATASHASVVDAYRTIALPLALQASGYEALHASAVRTPQGIVAFCAQSGTGKTTVAYALGRRGNRPWADDALVLDIPEDGAILAHQLPFRANVRDETRVAYGTADDEVPAGAGDEEPVSLAAVCVLERTVAGGDAPGAHRLHPTEALPCLLEHAHRFDLSDPDVRRRTVQSYLRVAARVPVLRVAFVPGFDRLEALLDTIESAIAESVGAAG